MPLVKIKTWDKMKSEYGLEEGRIPITNELSFCKDMENDLPDNRIIEIDENNEYNNNNWNIWYIHEKMIEKTL